MFLSFELIRIGLSLFLSSELIKIGVVLVSEFRVNQNRGCPYFQVLS